MLLARRRRLIESKEKIVTKRRRRKRDGVKMTLKRKEGRAQNYRNNRNDRWKLKHARTVN